VSEHITEPPAYDKPANEYVEKKPAEVARDLLNQAENRPQHITIVSGIGLHGAMVAADINDMLTGEAIRAGSIHTPRPQLCVTLPELPAGTTVEPFAFHVVRGAAKARIVQHEKGGWSVDSVKHEAERSEYGYGYNSPTLSEWRHRVHAERFPDPKGAVELAVAWLDALDSWHTATEAGRMSVENRLSGLIRSAD
jgi:hypothetical protein